MRARVRVFPRPEVLDPQGKAIRDALVRVGFAQVKDVRAGKSFDIRLDGADREAGAALVETMCQRLLSNPLIERYEIEVTGEEEQP
jgi:phosphoribosylformylglycinamidine synthase